MIGLRKRRQRVNIAMLLLALLIPAFLISTFHHHHSSVKLQQYEECEINHHIYKYFFETTDSDSWANCYICHFIFSPVTEAQDCDVSFEDNFEDTFFAVKTKSMEQNIIHYFLLRAPPIC